MGKFESVTWLSFNDGEVVDTSCGRLSVFVVLL